MIDDRPELITIEVNTFSEQEAQKVFHYLCQKVLKRNARVVKKNIFKMKNGGPTDWSHVMQLLHRYGINAKLTFEHSTADTNTQFTNNEINVLRAQRGMAALPKDVAVERLDPLNP